MWGIRRQVSLLLDHGHPLAAFYPLCLVWSEAELVTTRLNGFEATRAVLLQMAVSTLFSNKAAGAFKKEIKRLNDGGSP